MDGTESGCGKRQNDRMLPFEKVVKRHCRGEACLIRYADDFVCAFEDQAEAERFYNVLGQRREKFGLALSGAKTRLIPFSRHRCAGKTSFEFLGFEFRWGKDHKGKDHGSLVFRGVHNSMIFRVNKAYPYKSNWTLWNKCVTFKIP